MIVKGSKEEAEALARCLGYVAPWVDGLFITVTQPSKEVEGVVKLFGGTLSSYPWDQNFANARNYNFSQVPSDFTHILWLDADDALRGADKLKQTIEDNPNVDAFGMFYMYAFDEHRRPTVVHQKTQVVKNDGTFKWVGALHEDFKTTREVKTFLVKGIERLHLTNETRVNIAKTRNLEIAEADSKANPNDPRSWWNYGNALKANGNNQESINAFERFMASSQSDDEKYIAGLRVAEAYWGMGQKAKAIDVARMALGTKPEYPDAYNLLGSLYLETKQFYKAKDMYQLGLVKKPPYTSIIVYNPRDYDFVPLMNLAKVYFNLNLPTLALPCLEGCLRIYPDDKNLEKLIRSMKKEAAKFNKVMKFVERLQKITDKDKLAKELEKIPADYQSHPAVCNIRNVNFVKQESSGKDLVIFCGYTEEEWTPKTAAEKGIGGSEEAVIHLADKWADAGYNVTVFNNCGYKPEVFGKVTYKPFWQWNYRDKEDITVLWRAPRYLEYDINCPLIFLDLHDVVQAGELTVPRLAKVTKIFVKSKWHRALFPDVPDEKFAIVPNGIDPKAFEQDVTRNPNLIVNTSSPDRSLQALLDCFHEVKKQVPEAELKWAYGWGVFDIVHSENATIMAWKDAILERLKTEPGVTALGRVNHADVAKLYLEASIFGYPTEFAEIHCISAAKAQAAGAIPVTTNFAALNETVQYGVKINSSKTMDNWAMPYQFDFSLSTEEGRAGWVKAVVHYLQNPPTEEARKEMREWAVKTFAWDKVANDWIKHFNVTS